MFRSAQFLVVLLALGLAATASAQGERGVITGIISDAQGGVLPGVAVTVRNVDTGFTLTDVTGARVSSASERCHWAGTSSKRNWSGSPPPR